jgi:hypothetical protein
MNVVVIVQALFDSETLGSRDVWRFKAGDIGMLRWRQHRKHPRFLEPCVIWDGDPKHKVRSVILAAITVVGLQSSDVRVLLLPLSE